jgi:hypothetical protein
MYRFGTVTESRKKVIGLLSIGVLRADLKQAQGYSREMTELFMKQDQVADQSAIQRSTVDSDRGVRQLTDTSDQNTNEKSRSSRDAQATVETADCTTLPVRVTVTHIAPTRIDLHYPGALHRGMAIGVNLACNDGNVIAVRGWIKSCTPYSGRVHSIVVRLDEPIDLSQCDPVTATAFRATRDDAAAGVVAMCVKDRSDARLVERALRDPALTFLHVDHFDQLLDVVKHQDVDAVILDRQQAIDDQHTLSELFRPLGLRGGLVILSNVPSQPPRITASGGLRVSSLSRPVVAEHLRRELAWVVSDMDPAAPSPIPSTLADPGVRALVAEYARQLPASIERLVQRRDAGEVTGVRVVLREWHTSGESFGFATLSQAAADAMQSLHLSDSIHDASIAVRRALSVAQRIAQWQRVVDQANQAAA